MAKLGKKHWDILIPEIERMIGEGMTLKEITKKLPGLTVQSIRYHLRTAGKAVAPNIFTGRQVSRNPFLHGMGPGGSTHNPFTGGMKPGTTSPSEAMEKIGKGLREKGSEAASLSLREAGSKLISPALTAMLVAPMISEGFDVYNQIKSTGAAEEMVDMQTPQSLAMRAMLPREEAMAAQAQQALMEMLIGPQGPELAPGETLI